jgi:arsenate reductase (thioredoxin)
MAEALLRYRGMGRFEAFSAGSHPAGFVHPMTVLVLSELGISTKPLRSKSWDEFKGQRFDAVVTLCGDARDEECPVFAGGSPPLVRAHWGFPDPTRTKLLLERERLEAFRQLRTEIRESVERLALSPEAVLRDDAAFAALVREIAADREAALDEEAAAREEDGAD